MLFLTAMAALDNVVPESHGAAEPALARRIPSPTTNSVRHQLAGRRRCSIEMDYLVRYSN